MSSAKFDDSHSSSRSTSKGDTATHGAQQEHHQSSDTRAHETQHSSPPRIKKEKEQPPSPSHFPKQPVESPASSDFSDSQSWGDRQVGCHGVTWPGGPVRTATHLRRASPSLRSSASFMRVFSSPGPPSRPTGGVSREAGYNVRISDRPASPIAYSISSPPRSRIFVREDKRGLETPLLFKEGIDILQQRVDSLAATFRISALSFFSTAKWVLLLGLAGFLFISFVLFCLSSAAAVSYYMLALYSTPPPLHEFPAYFDYFPRIAMALSALDGGHPAFERVPPEGSSDTVKEAPLGTPVLGMGCRPQEAHELFTKHHLSTWPYAAHSEAPQHWRPPAFGGANLGGLPRIPWGFPLSALEDPIAIATIPFSNRSWELLPGDGDMFAAPNVFLSSHLLQHQQQQQQQKQRRGHQHPSIRHADPEKEEMKLPVFTVDITISLSLPIANTKEVERPPLMVSLFLYSHDGDVVARSSRPIPPSSSASSFLYSFLPSIFGVNETVTKIYLMEHFPPSLVSHLKYARLYLYPPLPLFSATLLIQPKPQGLRLFVIQHPYLSYVILTLLLLAAAAAAVCFCCCCCCGYLVALAAPPDEDVDSLQGPPSQMERPHQRGTLQDDQPSHGGFQGDRRAKEGGRTVKQQEENKSEKRDFAGTPNLRLRFAGKSTARRDS